MDPSSSQNSTSKSYTDVKTLPRDCRANKILDEQKSKCAGLAQENGFCSEFSYTLWWLVKMCWFGSGKSSIPIGAKVEISHEGLTLGVEAVRLKKTFQSAPSY
jgi:hypothetical protein